MDYSLLTEQQLQKRYYSLSQKIRDVLESENNLKIIHQICRAHQLNDDEKILIVEQLIGLILLGFVSADDLSREIGENIHLNHRHSDDVASEIDRKIFTSIRSEIEKVYSPVIEANQRGLEILEADKRGGEIASPSVRNDDEGEAKEIQYKEVEPPLEVQPPKIEPEPPIRIIGMEEETKPTTNNQQPSEIPRESALSPRESAPEEGPMIIHEETEFKPLSESKKSLKSLSGLFGFLSASRRKKEEKKPSSVRAEVEGAGFSKEISAKGEPAMGWKKIIEELKPIETKIKVVDYTEVPDITNNQQPITNNKPLAASEPEPPIRVVDDQQPTADNPQHAEPPIKIWEVKPPKSEKELEKTSDVPRVEHLETAGNIELEKLKNEEKKDNATIEPKIIVTEEEIKPKKSFGGKLFGFFRKKEKLETKKETEAEKEMAAELEIEKVEGIKKPEEGNLYKKRE